MISFQEYLQEIKEPTGKLKDACWKGYTAVGMKMKNGKKVPNCVPQNEEVEQIDEVSDKTLQSYRSKAHTQIQHYKYAGGKDKPEASAVLAKREPGMASATAKVIKKDKERIAAQPKREPQKSSYKPLGGRDEKSGRSYSEEFDAQFDLIEAYVEELALAEGLDPEFVWETLELVTDDELLEAAVDAKGHKSSTGGLTQKGRDAYNAKGANLQAPVTTPPSKLKAGSKAANRRKSFCARMGGMEGAMKKPNGEPTRKALALRKWNC
jgi:hypothetical protein